MKTAGFSKKWFQLMGIVSIVLSLSACSWPGSLIGLLMMGGGKSQTPILLPPGSTGNETPATQPESPTNGNGELGSTTPVTPGTDTNAVPAEIIVSKRLGLITSESGTKDSFTVKLNRAPKANVSLNLSSSDTTEITLNVNSLTFTPANWDATQEVELIGVNDSIQDGNQNVTIDLGSVTSTDSDFHNLNAGTVSAQNTDDDTAGVTVSILNGHIVGEIGTTSKFTVVLNSIPTADVTFPVQSQDTTEGLVSPSSLTFNTTNWNIPQEVTITGVDDSIADGNINFTVSLLSSTSTDPNYNGLSQPNIGVTNTDNDTAGVVINNSTLTTSENGTTASFQLALSSQPAASVTIPLINNNTAEGSLSASSVIFTTANWSTPQTVTVTGVDDALVDGNVNYTITVDSPTSTDTNYSSLLPSNVSVTNQDNDSPGFDITGISGHTSEDLTTANFKVRLMTIPSANVTITFTSSDTTEGSITSGSSLTFTPANWNVQQTVTVRGVNDSLQDGEIAYSILTNAATSTDPNYNGLNPPDVAVVNDDNDAAGYVIAAANPISVSEAAGKGYFTIKLKTKPDANVTFSGIASSNTQAGTVSPSSITFTPTNWSATQTITITGVENYVDDDAGITFTVQVPATTSTDPSYNGLAGTSVNAKTTDNDTKGYTYSKTKNFITGDSGKTDSFTFKLNSQPTADVVIPVSSSDPSNIVASPSTLTFTPANWNTAQTVTLTGQPDGGVIDGAKLVYISLGTASAGSSFKDYFPNATGSDYDALKITDNNGTTANNGVITVNNCDTDAKIAVCLPPATELVTTEAGGSFKYYVLLNKIPDFPVTIGVSSSNTAEGVVSTTSIVKDSSNWDTIQFITVSGVNDPDLEAIGEQLDGNKVYNVIHALAVSDDLYFSGFDPIDLTVTNNDSDTPNIIFTPASSTSSRITLVNNGTTTVKARLNAKPAAGKTVSFTLSATGFTSTPNSLTFDETNWNTDQDISVTFSGTTGTKTLNTGNFTSTDTRFNAKTTADVFFNIVQPGFTYGSVTGNTINANTHESGTTATFTMKLNAAPNANVVVTVVSANTDEVIVQSGATLTFTPANWSTNQTVTLKGVDDGDLDGDQLVSIQITATSTDPSYASLDPPDLQITNGDND